MSVSSTRRASSRRRRLALPVIAAYLVSLVPAASATPLGVPTALAAHTPDPTTVTIAGSLQSELGCPGDWDPGCATTHLAYDAGDTVWQGTWTLPAGSFDYKAAINDSWDENYGLHAESNGANIALATGSTMPVKFYYDHKSHWITDNKNSVIAVAPGDFQSELGCPGDWDPGCLRSWLEDPDGDGIYRFVTTDLPAGDYQAKVAINEDWAENYGPGGVPNSPDNFHFTVPANGAKVTFTYNPGSHVMSILAGHTANNDVEWDGLRHDSRDPLYRTPGGAVPQGTNVKIRFRTFHADVTGVKVRFFSVDRNGQQIVPMTMAAADVSCYEPGLESETCDFWSVTLPDDIVADPDVLWYRFIVTDGTDTDYYADNTAALDGGLGAPSDAAIDRSWALSVTADEFTAPSWAKNAVVYQIFPDRFRNGRKDNDPATGDLRYDDPVLKLDWSTLPEGYCRNYTDANANCPWRFDDTPPDGNPTIEGPRGRDYMGGDLKGVDQQLDYLASLGVTAIYFNPIFDAASNHSYDTQDYTKVDPYFGTQKDFDNLVKHAKALGIRVILDGVFNHMSSDSPFFDRYHHYLGNDGACESATSPYRGWFTFHNVAAGTGTCVSSTGVANGATYDGWFGFDSIPVLTKSNPQVKEYFLTGANAISKLWLRRGAGAWRMDVSGDASFPSDYWPAFRTVVKATRSDALTISETWQKDSTLLRMILGDRLDTTMNYRLRDAVIAFLAPGPFDSKGFADSGHSIPPSVFAERMASQREDYADAAYYSLMNLLDSHDTERLLWTLTPGDESPAGRELDAGNVAAGKRALRLASVIQFTVPGMPTVYYGDEAGITGDDDPDDRRTYPWADLGGSPDANQLAHYRALGTLRHDVAALTAGDFRILLTDDAKGVVAYGRKTGSQAAIVLVNRGGSPARLDVPLGDYLPNGVAFTTRYAVGSGGSTAATASGGHLALDVPARGALVLATGSVDLTPPGAPTGLQVTAERANGLDVAWNAVSGAAGYDVYVSPVSGGGYVKANDAPVTGLSFSIDGLPNAKPAYVVVRARDAAGNAGSPSNETSGLPHVTIGWSNLQWPPSLTHTISAVNRTDTVYGQVWIDGVTSLPGPTPSLRAQLGFGPDGSNPSSDPDAWTWVEAEFNVDVNGANDEFKASLLPDAVGQFDYAYRYSTTGGRDWVYADLDGSPNGYSPAQAGALTVNPSGDSTPPSVPSGLHVGSSSPSDIVLVWDAIAGDPSLFGYEVLRSGTSGGPYVLVGSTSNPTFTDASVDEGATYWYVVRSVDLSFNRSAPSAEVTATASPRTVTVVFTAEVPSSTEGTGRTVNIAGTLNRLDGGLPEWNPGATHLTRLDATHWRIQLTGLEGTQIEYKYVLDDGASDWTYVEKDAGCGEVANRQLTLSYSSTGTQAVNDVVANWRNVAPCGN
jgi:glycosidase